MLIICPDCGREVSDAAPACPHCGRPILPHPAATKPAPAAPPKPIAGIVVACVFGVLTLLWAHGHAENPANEDTRQMSNGVYTLGYVMLLIGALMSLGGHRWGNRIARAACWITIPLVIILFVVIRQELLARHAGEGMQPGVQAVLWGVLGFSLVPWLLYLYLFRKSRYP
jgi:predicted outer membrane lipoprotein/DNA-directed RNA polymerase subunit RPC12/RpoP